MDALLDYVESSDDGRLLFPRHTLDSQQALCSCALTCHAWRVRAQYLLWPFPLLFQKQQFARFKQTIQKFPNITLIRGILLGRSDNGDEEPDLRTAGELFMHSFPYMENFVCARVHFNRGPPLRVLRMRLPFFSSITFLVLFRCTFQSFREMLDVVWACSNLAELVIQENEIKSERHSAAGFQNLCATAENLGACRKLTRLYLDDYTIKARASFLLQI